MRLTGDMGKSVPQQASNGYRAICCLARQHLWAERYAQPPSVSGHNRRRYVSPRSARRHGLKRVQCTQLENIITPTRADQQPRGRSIRSRQKAWAPPNKAVLSNMARGRPLSMDTKKFCAYALSATSPCVRGPIQQTKQK